MCRDAVILTFVAGALFGGAGCGGAKPEAQARASVRKDQPGPVPETRPELFSGQP